MRHLNFIAIIAASLLASLPIGAQEDNTNNQQRQRRSPQASRGERAEQRESATPDLTIRAQDLNERLTQEIGNARWTRVIYRQLNLLDEQNAPLYYPVQAVNGQRNLFSTIFQLLGEKKIKAYEYLDGYEEFSEQYEVDFKEMLDRFHIFYEEVPGERGGEPGFVINESDIPSADVRSLYVKEAWYFDQNNSMFDVKILAICPILTSVGDMGETTMPMFWLPYENIRPYISNAYIMTSNLNNAMTFTMDDYFRRRMFKGDIIKTQNLLNQPLQAYCPTPDSLRKEQERIENQLVAFEKALWFQPDTTSTGENGKTKEEESTRKSRRQARKEAKVNAPKVDTPKAQRAAPVRSVRRR